MHRKASTIRHISRDLRKTSHDPVTHSLLAYTVAKKWTMMALRSVCYKQLHFPWQIKRLWCKGIHAWLAANEVKNNEYSGFCTEKCTYLHLSLFFCFWRHAESPKKTVCGRKSSNENAANARHKIAVAAVKVRQGDKVRA